MVSRASACNPNNPSHTLPAPKLQSIIIAIKFDRLRS